MKNILKSIEIYNPCKEYSEPIKINFEKDIKTVYNELATNWYFKETTTAYILDLYTSSYGVTIEISVDFNTIFIGVLSKARDNVFFITQLEDKEDITTLSDIDKIIKTFTKIKENDSYSQHYDNIEMELFYISDLTENILHISINSQEEED